jgi:hypothetical protein
MASRYAMAPQRQTSAAPRHAASRQ